MSHNRKLRLFKGVMIRARMMLLWCILFEFSHDWIQWKRGG